MAENRIKTELNEKNALVNKYLCNFIERKFLRTLRDNDGNEITQNEYAQLCGVSSSTISKFKKPAGYDVPLSTIYNICRHEKYSLNKFFTEFEKEYGKNIPD